MTADWGNAQLGEQARRELAAARDPRVDRAPGTPITDSNDAFAEIGRARRAAIWSLERVAGDETPTADDIGERQALWEQSQLAQGERSGGHARINAATVWGLHSALDPLVEQNGPAVVRLGACPWP